MPSCPPRPLTPLAPLALLPALLHKPVPALLLRAWSPARTAPPDVAHLPFEPLEQCIDTPLLCFVLTERKLSEVPIVLALEKMGIRDDPGLADSSFTWSFKGHGALSAVDTKQNNSILNGTRRPLGCRTALVPSETRSGSLFNSTEPRHSVAVAQLGSGFIDNSEYQKRKGSWGDHGGLCGASAESRRMRDSSPETVTRLGNPEPQGSHHPQWNLVLATPWSRRGTPHDQHSVE